MTPLTKDIQDAIAAACFDNWRRRLQLFLEAEGRGQRDKWICEHIAAKYACAPAEEKALANLEAQNIVQLLRDLGADFEDK